MDLSEDQMSHDVHDRTLPQFSELRPILNVSTSDGNVQSSNDESVQCAQTEQTSISKNLRTWTLKQIPDLSLILDSWDLSVISHLCENPIMKQMINYSNYSPNNILCLPSNNMQSNIGGMYSPSTSQANAVKQELDVQSREQTNSNKESQIQLNQQQTSNAVTEYLQKLQATSLHQLIKLQTEQIKKQKMEEEKIEQTQNNILNIPSIRSLHQQNSNNFINSDQMIVSVNPSDLNLQNEQQENESSVQTVLKVEQQVQTDLPKIEKKSKFRAKIEIKVSRNIDGTPLYYCPECNLAYPDKSDIEQHIQVHLQERKYQCKECGAMLKRKEHLDQHMRGHSDERPFKCTICQKAFKRNEHLTRHCVIHSGNKNFSCSMCQKAFSRKDHLHKHVQTHLGIRKNKTKEDSYYINQKDTTRLFDNKIDPTMMMKQESYSIKDACLLKHEPTFLQHLQKNPTLLHTFSSLKEQMSRNINVPQQAQSDNTNGNARYLMPS